LPAHIIVALIVCRSVAEATQLTPRIFIRALMYFGYNCKCEAEPKQC
jgi:hypothetical protein